MDNGTPIYDISKTCDHLFVGILSKPDAASVLVAEVLHQRFKQWASYLGVFAPENVSLDTRLKYSESVSQIVVQFLRIASRNLDRISKLDEVLKANNSAGEGLQRSVAEEVDHAPESGASSPLAESLRALKSAIDGLYRLGVAIRQSSSPTLNQRISNFAQENDDVAIENMVFFRLKHKFFDKDQKESNSKSPLSLYRQLAMSISFRYFELLYRQSRQEKMEKNRESAPVQPQAEKKVPDQKPEENIPPRKPAQSKKKGGPNELKKLAVANAGTKQQPEKSEGAPTTVNTKNILQKYAATEKSFAAPKSVLSAHIKDAKYPDPPKVDPRTREARCPFCGRPIFEMDLKKKDWWHHHLDQDLKLYTCLSETCVEPPQLFIRFHEWSQHMDEHHSTNWIEEIHKPLRWCCDVEHDDLYFDDEDEYDQHVKETHPEYEAEKAELKEWGELQRGRPPYTCPICSCVPEELAVIFPWLREGKLANPAAIGTEAAARVRAEKEEAARHKLLLHIGTHLKQLGLVSVAYFGDDANDNSMGGKRSSIPIDKDGKVLFVENPPDYFDPQFEGYMVPTEPKLLDEGVDWSDVNHAPFIVPFARNPRFTGHESHLAQLEEKLFTKDGITKIAITGLGGIGKTHLVLEFLYRTRDMHKQCSVIWVPATNAQSLHQAYVDVARKLGVPGWDEEMADVKKLVQEFLNKDDAGQWLLIFDGADDLDMWIAMVESGLPHGQVTQPLINYLPKSRRGAVIFTTRNRETALALARPNVVEVPQMDENAAAQLLKKCLVNPHFVNNRHDTNALLSQFTYLPLFIVQAAAYINENGITLADYLSLLAEQEEHIIDLLSYRFEEDGRYHNVNNKGVLTWLISIEQIRRNDPLAADYLSFMACVDPKDIPQSLLPPGPSHKKEVDTIATLTAFFFIIRRPADQCLDLHHLVHLAARNWLRKKELLAQWTLKAISRLGEVLPDDDHTNRSLWRTYLPHALYVLDSNLVSNEEERRLSLMRKCGLFCLSDERWKAAEVLFGQLTEVHKRVLGVEHSDTLTSMNNLALTYWNQGRWKETENLQVRVMEIRKRVLGEEHPDTLTSMNNLASTYRNQGRWKEAEELEVQVMETSKRVLGAEHPDTLTSIANLASTYRNQGQWKEAEELQVQVMDALQAASYRGHDQVMQMLLDKGADINAQGGEYGNALQAASYGGHDQVVQMLLDKGADINAAATGSDGRTALQAAAEGGHLAVVERLLQQKADVNAAASEYNGRTALQAAAEGGHLAVVERLLQQKADVNAAAARSSGRTALQAAAEGGHLAVVERLLQQKADVNAASEYGRTALQAAAEGGHLAVVERLLQQKADVNAASEYGRTALQAAAEGGHLAVVERLLQQKADVNAASEYGRTALQAAAEGGHLAVVERLLQQKADVNAAASEYNGRTALQAAAEGGHLAVVERLLQQKADVNAAAARSSGRTALQAAAEGGHLAVVERLLQQKADVNAAAARSSGRTALQAAAEGGHLAVVERLLQQKADVNAAAARSSGRTALQAAAEGGHLAVVERLRVAGAR